MICPACGGIGSLRSQRGFFQVETTCERCQGERQIIPRPCPKCAGVGRLKVTRAIHMDIPRGVDKEHAADFGERVLVGRAGG